MGERKEGLTQRDPIAARVIAGVCIAMCGALAKEGDDPQNHHEQRYIYKVIAQAVGIDVADLTAEIDRFNRGRRFEVITGGAV